MRRAWTGLGTALVTPFKADGSLDEPAIRRLAQRQVEEGVHFVVPCGTTGESPTLTREEHLRVVELVVDAVAGRIPVLAGAGGYNTHEVVELARALEHLGAQGILSVTPYYNKPTQDGLVRHYETIAAGTSLPVIIYNVPGRTGCNVEPRTLARLAAVPTIVGVKEASGNMTQICEVMRLVPDDFIVLSGDDAMALPVMAVGGRGLISVASNVVPACDGRARRGRRTRRLLGCTQRPPAPDQVHARQFRRVEPDSRQGRDGHARSARGALPAADGAAFSCEPRPDCGSARGIGAHAGRQEVGW